MTEETQIKLAAFRYRLIAEALEAPKAERNEELCKTAAKEYFLEDGTIFTASLRTLQRWVKLYEKSGITGLTRKARKDRGKTRVVVSAVIQRLIALRKEGPDRSTPKLIDIVERAGEVAKGTLKCSTVNRSLDHQGASRRMLHVLGTKRHIRMSFDLPMDFIVGDFHHGPYVRLESSPDPDAVVRAKLGAFIDHASRYVPESRYDLREDVMAVRRGVRTLGTVHGLPRKLYVDNGSAYQANRFHFACGQLGIDLVHSKPYVSEGRGLIERFNRTVKEAFETEVNLLSKPLTLKELNTFWFAWLEEHYHRISHSETKEPPFERWQRLGATTTFQRPDPVLLDEVFRLHARRTVHSKTSTVEIGAVHFGRYLASQTAR